MKQITDTPYGKYTFTEGGVCAAKGFKASGFYCGIKAFMKTGADGNESPLPGQKNDIALIVSDVECNTAGVYTSNKVKGAPILVTKEHIKWSAITFVVFPTLQK